MDRTTKNTVGAVCVLWIALVAFLYFYAVTPSPSPASCRVTLTCVGPAAEPWIGIEARESHGYYHDAVRFLFRYDASADGNVSGMRSSPVVPVFLWSLIAYAAFVLFSQAVLKKKELDTRLSPFALFVAFSFVFLLTEAAWQAFYGITEPSSGGGIIGRYAGIVAALAVLLSVAIGIGRKARQRFFPTVAMEGIEPFLVEVALGTMAIVGLVFLLLLAGHYGMAEAWILVLVIAGWCWREIRDVWAAFFRRSMALRCPFAGAQVWLAFSFFVLLSHNVLELMRPIPIGFDDLGLYMIIPKVLSEQGALITGVDSYAWGIFMSLGFTLFDSATITLFLSSVAGILSSMAVYAVVRRYAAMRGIAAGTRYALLSSVLFYSLPSLIFQSSKDMKVDFASLFFQLMAVLLFFLWYGNRSENDRHPSHPLVLMGLFLGFSFVTKYTALFLIVALGGFVTVALLRAVSRKTEAWKTIGAWIMALVLPLLPIMPGIAYNLATTPTISLATFRIGPSQAPVLPIDPPLKQSDEERLPVTPPTGVREELGRYVGYSGGWRDYLRLPFSMTFNSLTSGIYVDIGFIFLAFVPLLAFAFAVPGTRTEGRSVRAAFLGMGVTYWLLWAALANGVIWYGYGGLIFLIVGVVEVIAFLSPVRWAQHLAYGFLGLWIALSVLIRSAYLPDSQLSINRLGLDYARSTAYTGEDAAGGEVFDGETFLMSWIPTYVTIRDTVNAAIEADPATNVYRVGTFTKYFLTDSFARVLDDNQLDVFASAFADHDDERLIGRFRNGKFRYMIIDTNTATIDSTPERSLTKKYDALIDFVYRNPTKLKILANDTGVLFVEIL